MGILRRLARSRRPVSRTAPLRIAWLCVGVSRAVPKVHCTAAIMQVLRIQRPYRCMPSCCCCFFLQELQIYEGQSETPIGRVPPMPPPLTTHSISLQHTHSTKSTS